MSNLKGAVAWIVNLLIARAQIPGSMYYCNSQASFLGERSGTYNIAMYIIVNKVMTRSHVLLYEIS